MLPNNMPVKPDWPGFIRSHTVLAAPPLVPELSLYLASEITPLWRVTESLLAREDVPPPFWSFAWPGGQALARFILDNPGLVAGKRVFDFASGSGIVALAAKKAGAAEVIANDVDPVAIIAIAMNAAHNQLCISPLAKNCVHDSLAGFDLILAGDFCYEWPMAGYAVEWLRRLAGQGKTVLCADPGRAYLPLEGKEACGRYDVPTTTEVEDSTIKTTTIYRFLPLEAD